MDIVKVAGWIVALTHSLVRHVPLLASHWAGGASLLHQCCPWSHDLRRGIKVPSWLRLQFVLLDP